MQNFQRFHGSSQDSWPKRPQRRISYLFWVQGDWKKSPHAFVSAHDLQEAYRKACVLMPTKPKRFVATGTNIPFTHAENLAMLGETVVSS